MTSPRSKKLSLATLPRDVQYEILEHILTDTTDPARASVLRVCRTLHDAAGGLLYRNIHATSPDAWRQLFGDGEIGLLTVESGLDLAKHVRHLRLGRKLVTPLPKGSAAANFGTVVLANLVHLIIDNSVNLSRPASSRSLYDLRQLLSRFRPTRLTFMPPPPQGRAPFHGFDSVAFFQTVDEILGLPSAWPAVLRTLHFDGLLLRSWSKGTGRYVPWMSDWTIETVMVSSAKHQDRPMEPSASELLSNFFFDFRSSQPRSGEGCYAGWGKVEIRVDPKVEVEFRQRYTSKSSWITAPEDKHLVSLIVFVDENGNERKLFE